MMENYNPKTMFLFQHKTDLLSPLFFTNVLPLLISVTISYGQKLAVPPCTDLKAINWIRDAQNCNRYFICHFGVPLSMPPCPGSQVWSNTALNCVPERSRWNDCPRDTDISPLGNNKNFSQRESREHSEITDFSKHSKLDNNNNSLRHNLQKRKRKKIKNTRLWHHYGNTRLPTNIPLFTPKPPTKFWFTGTGWGGKITTLDFRYETTHPTILKQPKTTEKPRTIWERRWHRGPGNYRKGQRIWTSRNNTVTTLDNSYGLENVCLENPGAFLPHPTNCHWYYNCSLANLEGGGASSNNDDVGDRGDDDNGLFMRLSPFRVKHAGAFVWECRYPQLFDQATFACREFVNVNCGARFEPVDQCEYSQRQCSSGRCESCDNRFGKCRGRKNGIYPIQPTQWNSIFMTCYRSRNIAQDRCKAPKPIFSPERFDCVSLFEVPKANGGFLPDCSGRPDGYYPDEQGRCAIFFRCSLGKFRGYDECPPATVFDPAIPACQPYSMSSLPCGAGQAPLCGGKSDGLYADPFGRCTHFFRCTAGVFQRYHSCDEGIFDPLTQSCVISAAQTLRPCGLKPSPCETLPTGVYPDQGTNCKNFIECHQGIIITNGTCDRGLVFSATSGRCDVAQNAPPPCGVAGTCLGKPDGRYPALNRGCSFYYECYHGQFTSLRRCTAADGGFFFNPATGQCDYPQNICPPCGHRWWGCARRL